MKRVRIEVPATSANLGPGFDALGLALDLTDMVTAEFDPEGEETVLAEVRGEHGLTLDPHDNLLCQAYRLWGTRTSSPLPGVRFTLECRIPPARGFGSSAASIVAGLAAAAWAAEEKRPEQRMLCLADEMEGHPDNVAAVVMGGMTIAFRDGEEVRALHVANHLEMGIALYIPEVELKTAKARSCLPREVPLTDAVFDLGRLGYLITAIIWGRWDCLGPAMEDRLHQPYRSGLMPALPEVIASARTAGAYGASLSGAGPAVIALTPTTKTEAVAGAMEACARRHGWQGCKRETAVRATGVTVQEIKADEEVPPE
ncbi:MAG: homoserine kinase [Chloroflexota bacterium]|nr:homoserine kinase [Chloroflexota bacterium]